MVEQFDTKEKHESKRNEGQAGGVFPLALDVGIGRGERPLGKKESGVRSRCMVREVLKTTTWYFIYSHSPA